MLTVYGIKNCNTVKKALTWLDENRVPYQFHDYKKEGITKAKLSTWCKQKDWKLLVNTKGTTWRALPEELRNTITNKEAAISLMQEKTSVIKRPIIADNDTIMALGFDEAEYPHTFLHHK